MSCNAFHNVTKHAAQEAQFRNVKPRNTTLLRSSAAQLKHSSSAHAEKHRNLGCTTPHHSAVSTFTSSAMTSACQSHIEEHTTCTWVICLRHHRNIQSMIPFDHVYGDLDSLRNHSTSKTLHVYAMHQVKLDSFQCNKELPSLLNRKSTSMQQNKHT